MASVAARCERRPEPVLSLCSGMPFPSDQDRCRWTRTDRIGAWWTNPGKLLLNLVGLSEQEIINVEDSKMWPFPRKEDMPDWDSYLGPHPPKTRKQRLLEECKKLDVSIYVDESPEATSGIYGALRGVPSEAELERRLITKRAVIQTSRRNKIAIVGIVVTIVSIVTSFL